MKHVAGRVTGTAGRLKSRDDSGGVALVNGKLEALLPDRIKDLRCRRPYRVDTSRILVPVFHLPHPLL
jgi:hypothetical protein